MCACLKTQSIGTGPESANSALRELGLVESPIQNGETLKLCESFFAERLVESLERIRVLMESTGESAADAKRVRIGLSIAEANFWRSLRALERLQHRGAKKRRASSADLKLETGISNERKRDVGESVSWTDRLNFDPEVSLASPVVKGTWITAEQVLALLIDGWTWADIFRAHPELAEDDIRACLNYAIEEVNGKL